MTDIVKGLVEGGWALLVGWILPGALDVLLFALVVYPSVKSSPPFSAVPANDISLVVAAVVIGVVFSALKTPLYRILEGYILWPVWLFEWGQQRHICRRERLKHTINYAGYSSARKQLVEAVNKIMQAARHRDDQGRLKIAKKGFAEAVGNFDKWREAGFEAEDWLTDQRHILLKPWRVRKARADERETKGTFAAKVWSRRLRRQTAKDRPAALPALRRKVLCRAALPVLRRRVLEEKYGRYPSDEEEILPTVLGNAIRRFERFGPVHYGLDQQRLWYELTATAPERVSKQVDQMRTAVDFFVGLLFGQLLVGLAAVATFYFDPTRRGWLGFGALVAVAVAILSYRGAVVTSDEWSYAVQALLNVGRRPLADSLSLKLPRELEDEQDMWRSVGQFLRQHKLRQETIEKLDQYRAGMPPEQPQNPTNS